MLIFTTKSSFIWSANADGVAVRVAKQKLWKQAKLLKAPPEVQKGYRRMQLLAECGEAEVSEVDYGIFIAKDDAVRLDEITRR
ncbi:MAG: hypothetical protein KA004_03235 [Verrucomicrobiales bacterium]|nr:hypothetical protein [Verrucomicrobiales bacterium]